MMKYSVIFILLSLWLFAGCKEKIKYLDSKVVKYYPNGKVEFEREMTSGKKDGKTIEYFDSGTIKLIGNYKNDSLQGEVLRFYPNGKLELKMYFEKGVPQGMAYYFYPSGVISAFRYWNNGKLNGYVSDYWDTIGEVKAALHYDDSGNLVYKKNYDKLGQFIGQE